MIEVGKGHKIYNKIIKKGFTGREKPILQHIKTFHIH